LPFHWACAEIAGSLAKWFDHWMADMNAIEDGFVKAVIAAILEN
jgi:hypothetical protein